VQMHLREGRVECGALFEQTDRKGRFAGPLREKPGGQEQFLAQIGLLEAPLENVEPGGRFPGGSPAFGGAPVVVGLFRHHAEEGLVGVPGFLVTTQNKYATTATMPRTLPVHGMPSSGRRFGPGPSFFRAAPREPGVPFRRELTARILDSPPGSSRLTRKCAPKRSPQALASSWRAGFRRFCGAERHFAA